jgi:hypothetical protein
MLSQVVHLEVPQEELSCFKENLPNCELNVCFQMPHVSKQVWTYSYV